MAFNCRIFGHRGITQIHETLPKQFSADSVHVLVQPYEFSQVISVSAAAASSAPDAGTRTKILRIEIPDGQTVRYEINPPGRNVAAGNLSPRMSGFDQVEFAPGWTISLIDATALQ